MTTRQRSWLLVILALALLLRVGYVLALDHTAPYGSRGGDTHFYLAHGYTMLTGQLSSQMYVSLSNLTTAPLYLIFNGIPQALFPSDAAISNATLADGLPAAYGVLYAAPSATAVLVTRLVQALLATLTCYLAYRMAWQLTGRPTAGVIAAAALAISPAHIIESGVIGTETLYIFLVAAALMLYLTTLKSNGAGWRQLAGVGILLGLATLTRAVLLLFPLGLLLHLLVVYTPREAVRRGLWLLLIYSLVVSTWTLYNWTRYQRFIIAGEGFAAFLYIGAAGWEGPQGTDAQLADAAAQIGLNPDADERQQVYTDAASNAISSDPAGYIQRRLSELAGAYAQPHGTTFFPGESLRTLVSDWLRSDRSITGLIRLTQADAFWPKLVIYGFHYTSIIAGLWGIWRCRHRWRLALPLIGFILYITLVHLLLLALPRYIFPTTIFWWVFAAAALAGGPAKASDTPAPQRASL